MPNIESSPESGKVCQSCIRNFTIHFRRPYNVGKSTQGYDGEFGFDWIRDEYTHPMTVIDINNNQKKPVIIYLDNLALRTLRHEFYGGVNKFINEGAYISSWLSIFATNCQGISGSDKININGATLDFEVHQDSNDSDSVLTDDGTVLIFEASNKFLKISTFGKNQQVQRVEEPLINFINGGRITRDLGDEKRYFYTKNQAINIVCSDGTLDKNEYIFIKAKKGSVTRDVGMILVAKNNNIPIAQVTIVDVKVNGKILEKPKNYEYKLKHNIFNQCLIIVEVTKKDIFDLDELSKRDTEVSAFVKKWWTDKIKKDEGEEYIDLHDLDDQTKEANGFANQSEDDDNSERFKTELLELYERKRFKLNHINSNEEKNTYVFFVPLLMRPAPIYEMVYDPIKKKKVMKIVEWAGGYWGSASRGAERVFSNSNIYKTKADKWGNALAIYAEAPSDLKTLAHELGHTFGLFHIFQDDYSCYQGFTDNIMDYTWSIDKRMSKFENQQMIFRKFQADIVNKDRSVGIHLNHSYSE